MHCLRYVNRFRVSAHSALVHELIMGRFDVAWQDDANECRPVAVRARTNAGEAQLGARLLQHVKMLELARGPCLFKTAHFQSRPLPFSKPATRGRNRPVPVRPWVQARNPEHLSNAVGHNMGHHIPAAPAGPLLFQYAICRERPKSANRVTSRRSKSACYSITSSACASRLGGRIAPIALAAGRLTTSSNVVGCTTGMSPGFSPLRIRPV